MRLHNPPVIAVIEDDEAIREALSELLESFLFLPHLCSRRSFSGRILTRRFDCLITDLHLPGISGPKLQQMLKAQGSPIPVIIITSSQELHDRTRAMQDDASAYLTKPFGDTELIGHVMTALDEI